MEIERRLERIAAFFRLPHWPYDPEAQVAHEGEGAWRRLSLAAWLMMTAALLAAWSVVRARPLLIELALYLAIAFPVAYALHFRRTSRLLVNWLTFTVAFGLGILQLRYLWPLYRGIYAADTVDSMSFLILCFTWIMVFRAFSLRTLTELVQTILPCGSVILLVLLIRPAPATLGFMALMMLGALALLAAEHRIGSQQTFHPLTSVERSQVIRRRPGMFYSWGTLYILVLVVAVGVAYAAAQSELSGGLGEAMRIALARRVLSLVQVHENTVLPDASVNLARLTDWPNSDMVVFRVRAKQPGNWRSMAYHNYTGAFWQRGIMHSEKSTQAGERWLIPLAGSGASAEQGTRTEQTFIASKILVGSLPTLFCPTEITLAAQTPIFTQQLAREQVLRYDSDRVVGVPRGLPGGTVYKVVSWVPPILPMRRNGVKVPSSALQRDLQLPESLPPRVRQLARTITAEATTPYEKARAIEQYLMYGYKYTLQVNSPWPNDFVDTFLFVTKKGFCHHFAGSMVILCRCIGLPARLASGFLRGEEDADETDLYIVREKDAHVWPEVYFEGRGWTAFEPTPAAAEEHNVFSDAWKQITTVTQHGAVGVWGWITYNRQEMTAAAVLAGLALVCWIWWREKRRWAAFAGQQELARVVRAYVRMRRLLTSRGAPGSPALGPREFLALLPAGTRGIQEEALALTEKYLLARFGGQLPSHVEAQAAEQTLQEIRRGLRRRAERRPV